MMSLFKNFFLCVCTKSFTSRIHYGIVETDTALHLTNIYNINFPTVLTLQTIILGQVFTEVQLDSSPVTLL